MVNWKEFESVVRELGVESFLGATVYLDDSKKCNYSYGVKEPTSWSKTEGWVYFIVIGEELIKIGKTDKTLAKRFASYTAGTEENRAKGTCSSTNYHLSKLFIESLVEDREISIYAFHTPVIESVINVLGKEERIVLHTSLKFESALLEKCKELYGCYPEYSANSNTY